MNESDTTMEPDWDTPVSFTLSADAIMRSIYASAETVHTGWDSCIEHNLVISDVTAADDQTGNHCRLVEQEYVEESDPDATWRDWAVELKIGEIYMTAHWRARSGDSPSEWDWCTGEAETAFSTACLLVGKRARRSWVIEDSSESARTPRTRH